VKLRRAALGAVALAICAAGTLYYHQVDKAVTAEDAAYIPRYVAAGPHLEKAGYEAQIRFIEQAQRAVLNAAPRQKGLPYRQPREPKQLLEAGNGACYDRSRAIEKILTHHGFETRHVFLLSTEATGSALKSLLKPGVSSHAVTEVRTEKGWVVVDSNSAWMSIAKDGRPVAMREIQRGGVGRFANQPAEPIFFGPFTFVYGLYSRHGYFYAPYNPIPDVNYRELLYNLTDRGGP